MPVQRLRMPELRQLLFAHSELLLCYVHDALFDFCNNGWVLTGFSIAVTGPSPAQLFAPGSQRSGVNDWRGFFQPGSGVAFQRFRLAVGRSCATERDIPLAPIVVN